MEFRRIALIVALPLLAVAPAVLAENWQPVGTHSEVDVDSIHVADDGLVHYMDRDPPRAENASAEREAYEEAFDCTMMISYVGLDEADWKANGRPVKPNTHGSDLMEFVCARATAQPPPAEPPADAPPAEPPATAAPPVEAPPAEETPPPPPPAG
jgi:hypothetical protein